MSIRIRREGLRLPRDAREGDTREASSPLDDAPGGTEVVEPHRPGRAFEVSADVRRAAAPSGALAADDERCRSARRTIAQALFKDAGRSGSTLQHPSGLSFTLDPKVAHGEVRSPDAITVPLPEGHTTRHTAAIHLELDNGARLVLDVLPSYASLETVKAHGFDALQLRRLDRCFSALVFLRCPGAGLTQEQVEGLGHGYDYIFGIDEEHIHSEMRYSALRSRVGAWLKAAAGL
jgi:hypothetical protein